jgi:hypothetical protein
MKPMQSEPKEEEELPAPQDLFPTLDERVQNIETLLTSIESEVLVLRLELEEIAHEVQGA